MNNTLIHIKSLKRPYGQFISQFNIYKYAWRKNVCILLEERALNQKLIIDNGNIFLLNSGDPIPPQLKQIRN